MCDVEEFSRKFEQIEANAKEILHKFEAVLHVRQSVVLELEEKLETRKLEKRRRKKAAEGEMEDFVALTQRYHLAMEMKKRDTERMVALADICDKKRKRLELHTLALQLHNLIQARSRGLKCLVDLAAKWAGLQVISTPGHGYRICFTLLDPRQPQRCCSLLLALDSEGKYKVFNCEPALASLDGPLTELRETCNLVQFVLHIRQQFKDLLLASPPSSEPVKTSDEHRDAVADP